MEPAKAETTELTDAELKTCAALGALGPFMAMAKMLGPVRDDTPWAIWAKEQEKLPNIVSEGHCVPNELPDKTGTQFAGEADFRFLHRAKWSLLRYKDSRNYPCPIGLEDVVRAYIREHGVPE